MKSSSNLGNHFETKMLLNKIETLKNQLISNTYKLKRTLNLLDTTPKFITGTPEHNDAFESKVMLPVEGGIAHTTARWGFFLLLNLLH